MTSLRFALSILFCSIFPAFLVRAVPLIGDGDCSALTVSVEKNLKRLCPNTEYCYVFKSSGKDVIVANWEISGDSPFVATVLTGFGSNTVSPGKVAGGLLRIRDGITYKKCFTVEKHSVAIMGNLVVKIGTDTCNAKIQVPSVGVSCNCELNTLPEAIIPGKCDAVCGNNLPNAEGIEIATRPVIKPAIAGVVCTSTFERPCTKKCPVSCVKTLEPTPACDIPCGGAETTYTLTYNTLTTAQNGGRACNDKNSELFVCKQGNQCPVNCVMGDDLKGANCAELCEGKCDGTLEQVNGKKLCTKATLVAPLNNGAPCTSTTTYRDCKKTCPLDCIVETPKTETIPCPANEQKPTSSYTLYGTIIRKEKNGGRACPTDLSLGVVTCTLKMLDGQFYDGKDCVVDGSPRDVCAEKCTEYRAANANNEDIPIFTAEATYPITLAKGEAGGNPCPTLTRECNCNDCSLDITPTEVATCDAKCRAQDNSNAMGKLTQYFSVTEIAKKNGKCTTTKVVPCSTRCSCLYASSITKDCAFTSTDTSKKTWTAYGIAEVTPIAEFPSCNTAGRIACSKVLKQTDCAYKLKCPSCECAANPYEGNYVTAKTLTCKVDIQRFAENNGNPCPKDLVATKTCKLNCPGCEYSATPICHCLPTDANTIVGENIQFTGTEQCSYPLLNYETQFIPEEGQNQKAAKPLCTERIDPHKLKVCTVQTPVAECWAQTLNCGHCTFDSKIQQGNDFFGIGKKECSVVDFRGEKAPAKCLKKIVTGVKCTEKIPATNCRAVSVCAPCVPTCEPLDEGLRMFQAPCYFRTVTPAMYGGTACPAIDIDSTQCSTICTAAAEAYGAPPEVSDNAMNAFFAEDISLQDSSIGGRLILCGSGELANINIGYQAQQLRVGCSEVHPMLYVNQNLLMVGSVFGGKAYVGGLSSPSIVSNCGQQIKAGGAENSPSDNFAPNEFLEMGRDAEKCFKFSIDCPKITKWVNKLSKSFSVEPQNAAYSAGGRGTLKINWDLEKSKQVLWITEDGSNPVMPFNEYNLQDPPNGPILINIFGETVTLRSFSLRYFSSRAENVFWNFPDAKSVTLQDITIYGTVLAPNAIIRGNGQIVGKIYAKAHKGTFEKSVKISLAKFSKN